MLLGLNELEANAYIALLADGPATAYQLAQRIGKQTANVYRVVDALAEKGAVAVQSGKKQMLTAIDPDEFLSQLQRRHQKWIDGASKGLRSLHRQPNGGQLYSLDNVDAVIERARAMLAAAQTIVVIDAFPKSLAMLEGDISKAHRRKVSVYVQAYSLTTLKASSIAYVGEAEQVLNYWKSEQLNLVVDGREVLLALCRKELDGVVEAYWSNSVYLACTQHAGFLREHVFHQMHALLESGKSTPGRLKQLLQESPTFHGLQLRAQKALIDELGGDGE